MLLVTEIQPLISYLLVKSICASLAVFLKAKPLTFGNKTGHIRQLQNTSEGDSPIGSISNIA